MYVASHYWPADVPATLWQFELLVSEDRSAFPFVGIAVSSEFVAAFLAGAALICVFASRRFSEPSYDVKTDAFKDFKDLTIWNLKDSASLRRAYVVYCIFLVFIYAALAFFGRVIFTLISTINVSGLETNVGTVDFDSWRWPIFLAIGLSGLAPLINPLVPAETWLRRFSHEVVGIPTRLQEKTVRLKTLIDGGPEDAADAAMAAPDWVKAALGSRLKACFALHRNLGEVAAWSYGEHVQWSDPEIRRKLNDYETRVRDETERALHEFAFLTASRSIPSARSDPDRRKELERQLSDNVRMLEECRDKFSVIMAIYCEHGATFNTLRENKLRSSILNTAVYHRDLPSTGLPLYAFLLVFVVYYVVVETRLHSLLSSVPHSETTVAVTAALETLKVFLLVWFPLVLVSSFGSVVNGPWAGQASDRESVSSRSVPGALGALAVAAVAMALYAILYAALPAMTVTQMTQTLFDVGALYYFLLLAPIAPICYFFVNLVRAPVQAPHRLEIAAWAATATALVAGWLLFHAVLFQGECSRILVDGAAPAAVPVYRVLVHLLSASTFGLSPEDFRVCYSYYGTTDLLVIPAVVFLSVMTLARHRLDRPRNEVRAGAAAKAAGAAVAVLALALTASPARATGEVVLGFRTDIQPFSFVSQDQDPARPYLGYIAELCYEIFDKSGYEIAQVPVTASERFSSLRRPEGVAQPYARQVVDVLCDATTIRLDDAERMRAGVFSPVIFVSGISYLHRAAGGPADVKLGYVGASTSKRVSQEICGLDALRIGGKGQGPGCPVETSGCLASARGSVGSDRGEAPATETRSLGDLRRRSYVLCPMEGHDDLVEWFCGDLDNDKDKVYVGDRDLILGKLAHWRSSGETCLDVRDVGQSYTYEPYALLVSKADPELVAFVQRRVYEIFSHRAGAEALFYKWFPGQRMSEALAWLFLLNGVMEQDELLSGRKRFDGRDPEPLGAVAQTRSD